MLVSKRIYPLLVISLSVGASLWVSSQVIWSVQRTVLLVSCILTSIGVSCLMRQVNQLAVKGKELGAQLTTAETLLRSTSSALDTRVECRTASLAEERNLFRAILDGMSESVLAVDLSGELLLSNAAARTMLNGSLHSDARSLNGCEVVENNDTSTTSSANSLIEKALLGEVMEGVHLQKRRDPDLGLQHFDASARSFTDEYNAVAGAVIVLHDVSDLYRARADCNRERDVALAETNRRSEFLLRMSHQVRTPLAGIIGRTEMLLLSDLSAIQKRHVELIKSGGELLLTLANDLVDLTRMNAASITLKRLKFDLVQVLERVLQSLAPQASLKNVEVGLFVESAMPTQLLGDPIRLSQIFYNLLNNAIRGTQDGSIEVTASSGGLSDGRVLVRCQVRDTGCKISTDLADYLFDPFAPNHTESEGDRGSGLGLAVSRELVKLMGGQMEIDTSSVNGFGITFAVPIDKVGEESISGLLRLSDDVRAAAKILIVTKSRLTREVVFSYLLAWGLPDPQVVVETDAIAELAKHTSEHEPYSMILIDSQIGETSAASLAERIRAIAELRTAKIIGVIAESSGERSRMVDFWIGRPIMPSSLSEALEGALSHNIRDQEDDIGCGSSSEELNETISRANVRVLAVDDNRVNRTLISEQLEALGYHHDVTDSAEGAFAALENIDYDIVLLDCAMPGVDGFQAATEIKRRFGTSRPIGVIALTAHNTDEHRHRAKDSGMDDFLSKPVRLEQLANTIDSWVAKNATRSRTPGLDTDRLNEIASLSRSTGSDVRAKILTDYLEDLPITLRSIESAARKLDLPGLAREAFELSSASGDIGASDFARVCKGAANSAAAGDQQAALGGALQILEQSKSLPNLLSPYL